MLRPTAMLRQLARPAVGSVSAGRDWRCVHLPRWDYRRVPVQCVCTTVFRLFWERPTPALVEVSSWKRTQRDVCGNEAQPVARNASRSTMGAGHQKQNCEPTLSTLQGFKIVDCAATSRRRSASRNFRLVPETKCPTANITQISKTHERS